jgi:hypothetical protein
MRWLFSYDPEFWNYLIGTLFSCTSLTTPIPSAIGTQIVLSPAMSRFFLSDIGVHLLVVFLISLFYVFFYQTQTVLELELFIMKLKV